MIRTTGGFRILAFILVLFSTVAVNGLTGAARQPHGWTPGQTIPEYHPDTDTPYLIADQNRTVHAFSSQWTGSDERQWVKAIAYNQWTPERGWTPINDILLSPVKEARIMGAFLDQSGVMHVIFYGGDNTTGDIYYAKAPAVLAGEAWAWSDPILLGEDANDPSAAAITGDDKGNLVMVYSGTQEGWGLYTLYSADGGATWTEPVPSFLTFDELFPFTLDLSLGPSGVVHMVWDVRDSGGNGRQVNYAGLSLDGRQWSEPFTLAEADTGYGVLFPTVVEHDGEIIAAYSGVTIRRSRDGGQTWTDPVAPFRHVGVNGTMSFVVDSNDDLHLLWAQRITASPDIHGVWHSLWSGGQWTEPQAVVSGPAVSDSIGDKAFDPFDVRAVVSQGNALLAAWRSDPGLKGNGVWYSQTTLDAPTLPTVPLPTVASTPATNTSPAATAPSPTPTPLPTPELAAGAAGAPTSSYLNQNPASPLLVSALPVVVLVSLLFLRKFTVLLRRR